MMLQGDVDVVSALTDGHADLNQAGNSGVTSLHIAAMCGHQEVMSDTLCERNEES